MTAPSPRRPKSLGLSERNLNKFDENHTLPILSKTRGVSLGSASGSGDNNTITFSASWEGLTEAQRERRTRQPRKSILKIDPQPDEPEPEPERKVRKSIGFGRRVSFAPSAHVRMFEKQDTEKRRRKLSMGMGMGGFGKRPSLPAVPRRSLTLIPPPTSAAPISPARAPRSPRSPRSPVPPRPAYFIGEGEEQGEESMEMSEDESDASADSDEILQELTSPRATAAAVQDDEGDGDGDSYATDDEGEDMEETTVIDAQWAADADTDVSDDEEEDMSLEDESMSNKEEATMDFTVALGGPMPSVPPQDARPNRASIGYLNPNVPGAPHAEPLLPGDDTEESMMETAVYGGGTYDDSLSGDDTTNSDPEGRTATYNYTHASGMEFTTAVGGPHASRSGDDGDDSDMDMEMTVAVGGIHTTTTDYTAHTARTSGSDMQFTTVAGSVDDTGAMEFTTVVGGVHTQTNYTETAMEFTTVVGGIHTSGTNIFDTTRTNIFDTSRPNIFAPQDQNDYLGQTQTGPLYPVLEPVARVTEVEDEAPAPQPRQSSSTPGRKTPRKSGTPSFMRPTASSASKSNKPTTIKKNPFAPSPDSPGRSRSKSRTPTRAKEGMATAASVAKKLDFTSSANTSASSSSSSVSVASTVLENVFAPPEPPVVPKPTARSTSKSPRKSLIPRRSGTPKRPREDKDEDDDQTAKRRNIFAPGQTESRNIFAAGPEPEPVQAEATVEVPAQPKSVERELEPAPQPDPELAPEPAPEPDAQPREAEIEQEEAMEEDMSIEADEDLQQTPESDNEEAPGDVAERFASPEPTLPVKSSYTPIRERPRSSFAPRKSMGTPVRPQPIPREPTPEPEPEEPAPIRLAEFLELTGVQFMDNLTVGDRRKSLARFTEDREPELADFVAANVEAVYVNFFQWAIDKMQADIADMGTELGEIEAKLDEDNPIVVREYLSAGEDERGIFEMMLREYKTNTMHCARSNWYDWKRSIMERIRPDIQQIRDEMAADAERYKAQLEASTKLLPDLRARHEALKAELAAQRAAVERIEACDQDELRELKEGVAEQGAEIARFTTELDDKTFRLAELQERSKQLEAECDEHKAAIEQAKAESSESSPSDVIRLDAELRALQDLHGWRMVRANPLEIVYADELELTVPLVQGAADIGGASLGLLRPTTDGPTAALLDLTRRALVKSPPATLAALVRSTGQLWTAARHMRDELNILKLYYPSEYAGDDKGFTATASVVIPKHRAKVRLAFAVGPGTLLAWPSVHAVTAVRVRATTVYGNIDTLSIQNTAQETLASVVPDVPGVFYQACASAAEV